MALKLSITNTRGLCSNFVECKSFIELNSPKILALCGTHLDDSIDSGNFFVYLIWLFILSPHLKGFCHLYAWFGRLCEAWASFCTGKIVFRLGLLHLVSYFFFLYRSFSSSLCTVLMLFHLT